MASSPEQMSTPSSPHGNGQGAASAMQREGIERHAVYPPVVESMEKLGYIKNADGRVWSRDIGRSIVIGGHLFYIFGDTFTKDDDDTFGSLQSNSVARVAKEQPLVTRYLGKTPENFTVDWFIPLDDEEKGVEATKLPLNAKYRVCLWCFGGIAETYPGVGWLWYEKSVHYGEKEVQFYGVGMARVCIDKTTDKLHVDRIDGRMLGNLHGKGGSDMIFGPDEPRFGSFSVLLEGDFIYLWGTHSKDVLLARVPKDQPHVRNYYRFWDGTAYIEDIDAAKPLMPGMAQGAVFKSTLFGKDKPWVVVGCTHWKDSMIMIGAAATIEGPWEFTAVAKGTGWKCDHLPVYCMYPHAWLFDEGKGELAVSFSECWPGNVILAKLKFRQRTAHWRKVSLDGYCASVDQFIIPEMRNDSIVSEGKVTVQRISTSADVPVHIHIEGEDEGDVRAVEAVVENRLAIKSFEEDQRETVKAINKTRRRSSKSQCILRVLMRRHTE